MTAQRFEEYKTPVEPLMNELRYSSLHWYYTCYRDEQAVRAGWDFYRLLWVDHIPD